MKVQDSEPKQRSDTKEGSVDSIQYAQFETQMLGQSLRKSKVRYIALVLACFLMFGNNYSFDNPQALQRQLMTELDISISQYNYLYSAFSFPNIFLTLVGGLIVDFFGVRFGTVLFCALVAASQTIVAIGGTLKLYWVMLLGRVLFGISSENLMIAQAALVGKWFRGPELSTAIGYIMTVPELASAANSLITPWLYEYTGTLVVPLFTSVGLCVFSFMSAIVLVIMDKKADQSEAENHFIIENKGSQEHEEEEIEKVSFTDIRNLTGTFWILVLISTFALGSYVPFLDDANDFCQEKFEFTSVQAGRAFTSPFLGPAVDKIGNRRALVMVTCLLFATTHFIFGFMSAGEHGDANWLSVIPLMMLGCSFAMYSCVLIPCVQHVVDPRIMGTAFGLLGMLESVALAFFPIIAAFIVETASDKVSGYSNVGYFFCGMSILGALFTISLYFFDKKGSQILDFINPQEPNEMERKKMKADSSSSSSEEDSDDEQDDDQKSYKQYSVRNRTPNLQAAEDRKMILFRTQSMGR